jgi:hypothetical protein
MDGSTNHLMDSPETNLVADALGEIREQLQKLENLARTNRLLEVELLVGAAVQATTEEITHRAVPTVPQHR